MACAPERRGGQGARARTRRPAGLRVLAAFGYLALTARLADGGGLNPIASASRRAFVGAALAAAEIARAPPFTTATEELRIVPGEAAPFNERREYLVVRLPNGLRAMLVSDAEATRAEAALAIAGAGQFADPAQFSGLAHLCEHMTFADGQLEAWLEDRDGASNAFTGHDLVCFHLGVEAGALEGALQRFGGLFARRPAFAADTLKREVGRVDAELASPNDIMREHWLLKSLANPAHPFSRFGAGDARSLADTDVLGNSALRSELEAFWDEHYRADAMVLVVVAPAPLSALRRWTSKVFSRVPMATRTAPDGDGPAPWARKGLFTFRLLCIFSFGHQSFPFVLLSLFLFLLFLIPSSSFFLFLSIFFFSLSLPLIFVYPG